MRCLRGSEHRFPGVVGKAAETMVTPRAYGRLVRDFSKTIDLKLMDPVDAAQRLFKRDLRQRNSFNVKCPVHEERNGEALGFTLRPDGRVMISCASSKCPVHEDISAFNNWAAGKGIDPETWLRPSRHHGEETAYVNPDLREWQKLEDRTTRAMLQKLADEREGVSVDALWELGVVKNGTGYRYPIYDGNDLVDYRRIVKEDGKWKVLNRKGGRARLVVPEDLDLSEPTWFTAGEWDGLAGRDVGLQTVWTSGGEGWVPDATELRRFDGAEAYVAYDNDDAGRKGAAKLSKALRAIGARVRPVVWPAGTEGMDLRDWINDDNDPGELIGEETPAFSFSFLPRGSISTREEIKPTALFDLGGAIPALFYEDGYHSLFGESEGGKSWVAQAAVAEVLRDGGTALYADYEKSKNEVLDRFAALGVTDEEIARLAYVDANSLTRAELDAAVDSSPRFDLTIIDGLTSSMRQYGKKGREEDDVTDWYKMLPRRMSGCVVAIDHVTKPSKENGGSGGYAIGSQAKKSIVTGVSYEVVSVDVLARGRIGEVKLKVAKDARGYVNAKAGSDRVLVALAFDATEEGAMVVRVAEERGVGAANKVIEDAIDLMVRESFAGSQRTAERWLKEQLGLSMHRARAAYHEYVERGFLDEAQKTAFRPSAAGHKSASKPRSSSKINDSVMGESPSVDALNRRKARIPRPEGESTRRRRTATHPTRGTKPGWVRR